MKIIKTTKPDNQTGMLRYTEHAYMDLSDANSRSAYYRSLRDVAQSEVRFAKQSVLKRVVVLCAGSSMSLLFPIVIFFALFILLQDAVTHGR